MTTAPENENMVWIDEGPFTMGSELFDIEGPPREVFVKGFWIDRYSLSTAVLKSIWSLSISLMVFSKGLLCV